MSWEQEGMIINGRHLLEAAPIKGMINDKMRQHGVSFGLSEAGYDIRIKQSVWFRPDGGVVVDDKYKDGNFCLASAIEEFQMPSDLVGVVHDKSTWARQGLSVFNTVIEPSWRGFLTLELVYHGRNGLHIPAGTGIAQVIFYQTSANAYYDGKYQNQADMPVLAKME
jgi:dCTP deaminase